MFTQYIMLYSFINVNSLFWWVSNFAHFNTSLIFLLESLNTVKRTAEKRLSAIIAPFHIVNFLT